MSIYRLWALQPQNDVTLAQWDLVMDAVVIDWTNVEKVSQDPSNDDQGLAKILLAARAEGSCKCE